MTITTGMAKMATWERVNGRWLYSLSFNCSRAFTKRV